MTRLALALLFLLCVLSANAGLLTSSKFRDLMESLKELLFDLTVSLLSAEILPVSSSDSWGDIAKKRFSLSEALVRCAHGQGSGAGNSEAESWESQTSTDSHHIVDGSGFAKFHVQNGAVFL